MMLRQGKPLCPAGRDLVGVVLTALGAAWQAAAQSGALPPSPVPVNPPVWSAPSIAPVLGRPVPIAPEAPPEAPLPPPVLPSAPPLTYPPPVAPAVAPFAPGAPSRGRDGWGPYGPPVAQTEWFALTEFDILKPVLHNRGPGGNPLGLGTGPVEVPTTRLPWAVASLFEGGYRLPDGGGYLALGYRFFTAEGSSSGLIDGLPGNVRTRLNLNSLNFDYGLAPFEPAPRYVLNARLGIQFSDIFIDSTATGAGFGEQAGGTFYGAGPHARLDLIRHVVVVPGLDLFGRLDGAVLFGRDQQHFRADGAPGVAESSRRSPTIPTLTLQLGLGYTPAALPNLHFTGGYQFENYWSLGELGDGPDANGFLSRRELTTQGLFLRSQYDF